MLLKVSNAAILCSFLCSIIGTEEGNIEYALAKQR